MDTRDNMIAAAIATVAIAIVVLQFGMYIGRTQSAEASASVSSTGQTYIDILRIQLNAARYDVEVEREKLNILTCESGIKHEGTWGDGGKSYGIAQFQYATFDYLRNKAGRPGLRWKNRDDQIELLDWALRNGYGKYWTCFQKQGPGKDTIREAKR